MSQHHIIKNAGLKITLPRLRILEIFHNTQSHLTAEEIYKMLAQEGLDIGLATVYRVLTQFEQAGLLMRHHFEHDRAVFELSSEEHHDHLVCMSCGMVREFINDEIERQQKQVAQENGFILKAHSLMLYGVCGDCQNQSAHQGAIAV